MAKLISTQALKAKLDGGERFVLAEALPEQYFRDGHLPGAVQVSHHVTPEVAAKLGGKDADIVVYCASSTCQNSHVAAQALERLGYSKVSVFAGGKQDWSDAGLPLVRE